MPTRDGTSDHSKKPKGNCRLCKDNVQLFLAGFADPSGPTACARCFHHWFVCEGLPNELNDIIHVRQNHHALLNCICATLFSMTSPESINTFRRRVSEHTRFCRRTHGMPLAPEGEFVTLTTFMFRILARIAHSADKFVWLRVAPSKLFRPEQGLWPATPSDLVAGQAQHAIQSLVNWTAELIAPDTFIFASQFLEKYRSLVIEPLLEDTVREDMIAVIIHHLHALDPRGTLGSSSLTLPRFHRRYPVHPTFFELDWETEVRERCGHTAHPLSDDRRLRVSVICATVDFLDAFINGIDAKPQELRMFFSAHAQPIVSAFKAALCHHLSLERYQADPSVTCACHGHITWAERKLVISLRQLFVTLNIDYEEVSELLLKHGLLAKNISSMTVDAIRALERMLGSQLCAERGCRAAVYHDYETTQGSKKPQVCGRCKVVRYCSRECQRID